MKVLLRFSKLNNARFVSHLDLLRMFQRALRRAKLPVAYSQGFHPHMLISFGNPLPLGICSLAEYAEVHLEQPVDAACVKERLNAVLPPDVQVLGAAEIPEGYPAVGSIAEASSYTFFYDGPAIDPDKILSNAEILMEKKGKKGLAVVNIRPAILQLESADGRVDAQLISSNTENLRADKFRDILVETYGIAVKEIVRNATLVRFEGNLEAPLGV